MLDPAGRFVLGSIGRNGPVGEIYGDRTDANPFCREATFVSTGELVDHLGATGFVDVEVVQTNVRWPGGMEGPDPMEPGHGDGSFVGLAARR